MHLGLELFSVSSYGDVSIEQSRGRPASRVACSTMTFPAG
jgi:hypothetical protein